MSYTFKKTNVPLDYRRSINNFILGLPESRGKKEKKKKESWNGDWVVKQCWFIIQNQCNSLIIKIKSR